MSPRKQLLSVHQRTYCSSKIGGQKQTLCRLPSCYTIYKYVCPAFEVAFCVVPKFFSSLHGSPTDCNSMNVKYAESIIHHTAVSYLCSQRRMSPNNGDLPAVTSHSKMLKGSVSSCSSPVEPNGTR